ncbi:unnamed protein product [Didymodactylos carnosus]|uniref:Uncharacterized protein n=1 Tax=Didymodactylos carnosus TaxID=1234261 RepID=A0A8S2CM00_9BILA|nr:unnamed protein product [Didymodactylos carnosus]CAF3522865.1 unnamed protein product [Didymodactylos carnosus]
MEFSNETKETFKIQTTKVTQLLSNEVKKQQVTNDMVACTSCGDNILSKYYLRVADKLFHEECLQCTICKLSLESHKSCFIKGIQIFCRQDYYKRYGSIKCSKCGRNIQPSDWVRRAKEHVYHLACFACNSCKRQLSTGEEFALLNSAVLCKTHYCESSENDDPKQGKAKRVRTTFTEEQLQVLQANFEVDSNPDGQDLERIAQITGLSKRVIQVYFQNTRARQKKIRDKNVHELRHQQQQEQQQQISLSTMVGNVDKSKDDMPVSDDFHNMLSRHCHQLKLNVNLMNHRSSIRQHHYLFLLTHGEKYLVKSDASEDQQDTLSTNHWSNEQNSPSMIYDAENSLDVSTDEYSTGFI